MIVSDITDIKLLSSVVAKLMAHIDLQAKSSECTSDECNNGKWPDGDDCWSCNGTGQIVEVCPLYIEEE